jgi:hypothetical protein
MIDLSLLSTSYNTQPMQTTNAVAILYHVENKCNAYASLSFCTPWRADEMLERLTSFFTSGFFHIE